MVVLRNWGYEVKKGWKTGSYSVCGKLPSQHSGQMFVDEIIFTDLHDSDRQWEAISGLLSCKKTCHVSFISTSGSHRPSKVSSFGGLLSDFDSIVVVKSLPEKPCNNSDKLYFAPPPEMAGEKFGLDRFWSVTSCFSEEAAETRRWGEKRGGSTSSECENRRERGWEWWRDGVKEGKRKVEEEVVFGVNRAS